MRRFVVIFTIAVHLALADAVAKELAVAKLKGGAPFQVIPRLFDLAYVENRGCAWGMLQGRVWPLAVFAAVAMAFLVWKREEVFLAGESGWRRAFGRVAECLLYAGIAGNLIDRVFRGYVVDFLDFHWGVHHFPCFNLADAYISVAAGLLIAASVFSRKRQ